MAKRKQGRKPVPRRTWLKERREALKLSQYALSVSIGVDDSTVERWEAGETQPSGGNLVALADANSVRNECLNRTHLRSTLAEYIKHCHLERTYRGLGNLLIVPQKAKVAGDGPVTHHLRLGSLLSFYQRAA